MLEIARENGVRIPTLCYTQQLKPLGACRMCAVDVEGTPTPVAACTAKAGLTSARCTNEDNYVFQKMFRGVLGTNNVDHCARL